MFASPANVSGMDLEWYAADDAGFVGYFTTGGTAAIPPLSVEDLRRISDSIAPHLQQLRSTGDTKVNPGALARVRPSRISDDPLFYLEPWVEMASRGFYAFDALDPSRYPSPYHVVATPIVPQRLENLPAPIAKLIRTIRIPLARFQDFDEIDLFSLP